MRASRQEQTGGAGVSEVSAAFERLGWGVADNTRHDLGTDLFVAARDERLFDLGLVVGVQVKTGDSYFEQVARDAAGSVRGWWFRDDDHSHIDAWLAHGLPHLIVLHDLNTRISYWVHVTADVVVSTGKGAKVLVPITNTVDDEHRDALLGIAASIRPGVAWEGSAWTGAASLLPRDLLRHALVVPRLVAPHPNAGHGMTVNPAQAVALLMQARVSDLAEFAAKHSDVPSLTEALGSSAWSWRFVGVLGQRLTTGEIEGLLSVVNDAPDPPERTASTVTAAAALMEEGRVDEAVVLLEAALARDDAGPVDHAWLIVQHSRACAEVGRVDEARSAALEVQVIRLTHADDVTATAIGGVAAQLLFNTSRWGQRDVADVVTSSDTTAAWWRAQTLSWGLSALADRTFKAWARDKSVTLGGSDEVNDQLLAASLTANHVGDQNDWRFLSGLAGQDALLRLGRDADSAEARRGLAALRLAGNEAALKLAVQRLASDGPATAVTLAAAEVRLDFSTRTTGSADLALLQQGGDLLDEVTADRSVTWLLAALSDPSRFIARTTPSYLLIPRLVDTLAALVLAASPNRRRAVIDRLIVLPAQTDQFLAMSWARVVHALPGETWDEETGLAIGQDVDGHDGALRWRLLAVTAQYDPAVRALLVEEARTGSLDALGALGDVRSVSSEAVGPLIELLAERANAKVRDARAGSFGMGGHDVGYALALLNLYHQANANWDALLELLDDRAVAGNDKRGALQVLAALEQHLPDHVRPRLETISMAVAGQPLLPCAALFGDERDATGAAADLAAALGVLDDDSGANRLLELLAGDADHRRWAARLARRLARPEDVGVLVVLARDPEPEVRAAAAAGLAFLVGAGRGGALAVNGLQRCLRDPGTLVAASIAATLAEVAASTPPAQAVLTSLCGHVSASVRATAARAASN
jgi:hypothetical protein